METASRYKHCFEIVTAGVILTARADTEEQMHQWVKTVSDVATKVDNISRLGLLKDGQTLQDVPEVDNEDYDEDVDNVDILDELTGDNGFGALKFESKRASGMGLWASSAATKMKKMLEGRTQKRGTIEELSVHRNDL